MTTVSHFSKRELKLRRCVVLQAGQVLLRLVVVSLVKVITWLVCSVLSVSSVVALICLIDSKRCSKA